MAVLRYLIAAAVFCFATTLAAAQTPNGYINPPVYGTGLIPENKTGTVTTTIPPVPNHPTNLVLYNLNSITSWTINLPNPAFDGQLITVSCTTSIGTLTIRSTDGSAIASGVPNSCAATANVTLQWSSTYNTWYVAGGGSGGGATSTTSIGSALYFARNYGNCTWSPTGDVGPCINLAIAAAAAQGGGTVMIPAGQYGISTAIPQSTRGVKLLGAGVGIPRDTTNPSSFQSVTRLIWLGAVHATMFNLEPSPNTGSVQSLYNVDVWGITFDCNFIADIGFRAAAVVSSHFNVGGAECQSINALFTTDNIADSPGDQDNDIWVYSRSTSATQAPIGIMFDSYGFNANWNFSYNRVHKAFAWFGQGDGIVLGDSDNNLFDDLETFRNPTGTGTPVIFSNHAYTSPNGITANGHPYSTNIRHSGSGTMIAGKQSGSTFVSTSGTNSCNGGGDSTCGPGTVSLTTTGTTNQTGKTLTFASTTGIAIGEAVLCNGSSLGGVIPGEIINFTTGTTALMTDGASGTVSLGAICAFTYGMTNQSAGGAYTLVSTGGNTFTLTAPAGGHTQSGISVASGTLTFTDVVLPWNGTATTGDSWTITVPTAYPADDIFAGVDAANSAPNPVFQLGATGGYARTSSPYWTMVGALGIAQGSLNIGNGTSTGQGAITLGGGAPVASGFSTFAFGSGVTASGFGSTALGGHNNVVSGTYSLGINDSNNVSGADTFVSGFEANDFGRFSTVLHGYGNPNGQGSAQHGDFGLWGSASGSIAVRGTADGNAATTTNCYNIANNSAYGFTANLIAYDRATSTKIYTASWGAGVAPHILSRGANAASTLIDGVSSAVSPDQTRSLGTLTGIAATLTADTTFGCVSAQFTPPTSNTDTWDFVFSFSDIETK